MSAKQNLFKGIIIYGVGTLGSKLIPFILFPILSFMITQEELGKYDFSITLISLLIPIFSLQISFASYRWLIGLLDFNEKNKIITNGFVIVLVSCLIFSFFYLVILYYFFGFRWDFLLLLILIILSCFFNVIQQVCRGLDYIRIFSLSGFLNAIFCFVFSLLFVSFMDNNYLALIYAYGFSNLMAFIVIFLNIKIWRNISFTLFDIHLIKEQLLYSLPFIPNSISLIFVNFYNKYIIMSFLGLASTGIFALAIKFSSLVYVINSVFIMALQDIKISSDHKDTTFESFFNFQISIPFLLVPVSPIFFSLFVSKVFFDTWKYIPLLALMYCYNAIASYLSIHHLKFRKTREIMMATISSGILGCFFSYGLIFYYDLYGVIIGMIIGSFLYIFLIEKNLKNEVEVNLNYSAIVISALLVISELLIIIKFNSDFILTLIALLNVLIFIILNKGLLIMLCNRRFFNF